MIKLPTANYPIHTFHIPSLDRECRFRPFLVKENKALMIAQGTEDPVVMVNTLKSVIQSCALDELNVDDLAVFDCEYLLIKLRAISVGEEVTVMLQCSDAHDGNEASRVFGVACDLNKVEVVGLENFNPNVKLSDNLMVKMSAPTIESLQAMSNTNEENEYETNFKIVTSLIKEIVTPDEVIDCSEIDPADMKEWVENLTTDEYSKILDFVQNLPRVQLRVEWDCPFCGKHNVRYLSGLMVFF